MAKTLKEILREQVGKCVNQGGSISNSHIVKGFFGIDTKAKLAELNQLNEQRGKKYSGIVRRYPSYTYCATTINPNGSFPIIGIGLIENITSEDLDYALRTANENYPTEMRQGFTSECRSLKNQISIIDKTIQNYVAGRKPSTRELIEGSISEPVLQLGTPGEGLTYQWKYLTQPFGLEIEDKENCPFNFPEENALNECFRISIGNQEIIRDSRKSFDKYLAFVSDNLLRDPTIRQAIFSGGRDEYHSAVQRYLDIEWARKDEAISMAQELKGIYGKQIDWLKAVLNLNIATNLHSAKGLIFVSATLPFL